MLRLVFITFLCHFLKSLDAFSLFRSENFLELKKTNVKRVSEHVRALNEFSAQNVVFVAKKSFFFLYLRFVENYLLLKYVNWTFATLPLTSPLNVEKFIVERIRVNVVSLESQCNLDVFGVLLLDTQGIWQQQAARISLLSLDWRPCLVSPFKTSKSF